MNDILDRAEALEAAINDANCNIDDAYYDKMQDLGEQAIELIGPMIAEINRLKSFSDDLMGNCNALRSRAQKAEAELERQAAYVARLEAAYLDEVRENIRASKEFRFGQQTPDEYQAEIDKLAREALERIKRGEKE